MLFVHFSRLRSVLRAVLVACVLTGVAIATTVVPPEFPELVNGSDYIVHARVTGVAAEKRAAARGVKIVTLVDLEVIEVIAGNPPAKVTLQLLGGKVGDEELRVGGMPEFRVGDEDILFVSANGKSVCPLYAMGHGRYGIRADPTTGRRYVVRDDGQPLQSTSGVARPLMDSDSAADLQAAMSVTNALTPNEFARQIKAAVKPAGKGDAQ